MNIEAYAERLAHLALRAETIGDREVIPPAMTVDECREIAGILRDAVAEDKFWSGGDVDHKSEQMIHKESCASSVSGIAWRNSTLDQAVMECIVSQPGLPVYAIAGAIKNAPITVRVRRLNQTIAPLWAGLEVGHVHASCRRLESRGIAREVRTEAAILPTWHATDAGQFDNFRAVAG